jgi:hypothetical protein
MKTEASIEIQIPLPLSYSLIYQGEASPLKGSSHPWVRWCVPILTPSPSIYRLSSPRENTRSTTGMPLGSNGGDDTWKMVANRLKVGSADPGSASITSPFIWVTTRWVFKVAPDVWVSWKRFARVVGP